MRSVVGRGLSSHLDARPCWVAGVVVAKPSAGGKASGGSGALVNVGLQKVRSLADSSFEQFCNLSSDFGPV